MYVHTCLTKVVDHNAAAPAPHMQLPCALLPIPPVLFPRRVLDARTVRGPEQAREYYEASLAAIRSPGQSGDNGNGGGGDGGGYSYVRSGDEELTSLFLVATAVVPAFYESSGHIAQVCA